MGPKFEFAKKLDFLSENESTEKIYFNDDWLINQKNRFVNQFSYTGQNEQIEDGKILTLFTKNNKKNLFKCIVKDKEASKSLLNKFQKYYDIKNQLDVIEDENNSSTDTLKNKLKNLTKEINNNLSTVPDEESNVPD